MKRLLITAYAVNPYKGSEDGTGWNIVKEIAKEYQVILITRHNNIPHLDKYFEEHPKEKNGSIDYYGFDLSKTILRLKKKSGSKGHVVYYYLWQRGIVQFVKQNEYQFDASLSLNFHSDSHPHFLWKLNKPCFWGPIGHHPKVPKTFLFKSYGWKAYLIDRSFFAIKWGMRTLNPSFRKAVRKSEKIFVINSSIAEVVGAPSEKTITIPAVAAKQQTSCGTLKNEGKQSFTVLCAGRFHFMKGFDVALRSYFNFLDQLTDQDRINVRMVIVGKGPESSNLKEIAAKSRYSEKVEWLDWVPHSEMKHLYETSDVFLFPSHEGAGMVVPEAMSFGVPVLAFNNYGPGELVAERELLVDYNSYEIVVNQFAHKLLMLFQDPVQMERLRAKMLARFQQHFTWNSKGEALRKELNHLKLEDHE